MSAASPTHRSSVGFVCLPILLLASLQACAKVYGPGGNTDLQSGTEATPGHDSSVALPAPAKLDDEEAPVAAPTVARRPDAPPASPASQETPRPHPYQADMPGKLAASMPAVAVADLSPDACEKEVARRSLPIARDKKGVNGVTTPMRLQGALHGVTFVTPPSSSQFGVMDCRLGLALDDLAETLSAFAVVEVHVDNIYRPHAHLPGRTKASQHAFGLAVDITSMELADGRQLLPGDDWNASIGDVPCGPAAVMTEPNLSSIKLRDMVCEVAREGLFHDVLTPSFNAAHHTHFHFDIKHDETHQAVR